MRPATQMKIKFRERMLKRDAVGADKNEEYCRGCQDGGLDISCFLSGTNNIYQYLAAMQWFLHAATRHALVIDFTINKMYPDVHLIDCLDDLEKSELRHDKDLWVGTPTDIISSNSHL